MSYLVLRIGKYDEFICEETETLEEAQARYNYEKYVSERDKTGVEIHIVRKEAFEDGNYDYLEKENEDGNQ